MREWARSPALLRQWAEEWVLPPLWDALFRLPLQGATWQLRDYCITAHVSVSLTLGLILSTTHQINPDSPTDKIEFSLHDGVTGFHIGVELVVVKL
ncbi:hypothetical protein Pelo_9439 [Pelomyxa schiedti]|nr:hypothetical protein Pelo_9439 [Pelomyxa schiedti]